MSKDKNSLHVALRYLSEIEQGASPGLNDLQYKATLAANILRAFLAGDPNRFVPPSAWDEYAQREAGRINFLPTMPVSQLTAIWHVALVDAMRFATEQPATPPAPFVHKKTGGKYQFVGNARLQTSVSLNDMAYVVVYRGEDGKLWVRASDEFMDRFVQGGRPNRMMCDDVLEAEAEAGGVLAASPEIYESMRPVVSTPGEALKVAAIPLAPYEMQSNHSRVNWAEGLIRQLPENHDGRNSWLLNYGNSPRPKDYAAATAPTPPKVDDMQSQFNAAIDFAIQQGSSAAEFLESWREGDTSEWPEFTTTGGGGNA